LVNHSSERLDTVFAALSDPTRRGILAQCARKGEVSVTELAEPYSMSAPAISRHLRVLEKAGLITRKKQGRVRYCRVNPAPMSEAARWLEKMKTFWEGQLDALEHYFRRSRK
jgi:DNA-binding transcriptional ArsR family regulator